MADDFLDELFTSAKKNAKSDTHPHTLAEPTNFHRIKPKADAVVLAIVRTRCSTCGSLHEYPGQWLLYRYDRSYSWTNDALESITLPREIRINEVTNACCTECFTSGTRTDTNETSDDAGRGPAEAGPQRLAG